MRAQVHQALHRVGLPDFGHRATHHLSHGENAASVWPACWRANPQCSCSTNPPAISTRGAARVQALIRQIPGTKLIATHDLEMVVEICPAPSCWIAGWWWRMAKPAGC